MNTPDLIAIPTDDVSAVAVRHAVPSADGPARWFRVASTGVFDDAHFARGAILMVSGTPKIDDTVVLVPVGRGAPKLGHLTYRGLIGDRGEPCDAARWRVAGVVRHVLPAGAAPQPVERVAPRRAPLTSPQLALFGGAAA